MILTMSGVLNIWPTSVTFALEVEPKESSATPQDDASLQTLTVSYADSAEWLERLPAEERDEQIRDWAVFGLANLLDFDQRQLDENFWDKSPVRDPFLIDLIAYHNGPGRSLLDSGSNEFLTGDDTLHVLVPEDAPYRARTIGMVLDNRRRDMEDDPNEVILYDYRIDYNTQEVLLIPSEAQPTQAVRAEYGYVEMQIETLDDLQTFLAQTQHLSQIRVENDTLWVGGWNWPDVPTGRVTAQDLTVLQQGYLNADDSLLLREPAFSLDSGPQLTLEELLPILEPLYPELVGVDEQAILFIEEWTEWLTSDDLLLYVTEPDFLSDVILRIDETEEIECSIIFPYSECYERIWATLGDRSRPWQLLSYAYLGDPPHQYARYEGGLEGTDVGMTYFYTDILAKGWFYDLGAGNPYGRVEGFVPKALSNVPWSHCKTGDESGRIWFGLNEDSLLVSPDGVNFGDITTRLFTLVEDPNYGEREIEPSYSFGQGVWWWDQHYLPMADYEPQYHRLDQLMRWSAAIAWLVDEDNLLLPEAPPETIQTDWRFDEWLTGHPELKWQFDIPFIEVPNQTTETVLRLFSDPYQNCDTSWISSGGVTGPRRELIRDIGGSHLKVAEPGLRRAGLVSRKSNTFIYRSDLKRVKFSGNNFSRVDTTAPKRSVTSLWNRSITVLGDGKRRSSLQIKKQGPRTIAAIDIESRTFADLEIMRNGSKANIKVNASMMDKAVNKLNDVDGLLLKIQLGDEVPDIQTLKDSFARFSDSVHIDSKQATIAIGLSSGGFLVIYGVSALCELSEELCPSEEEASEYEVKGEFVFDAPSTTQYGPLLYDFAEMLDFLPESSEWQLLDDAADESSRFSDPETGLPFTEEKTIIKISEGHYDKPLWLEVISGEYQLEGGAVLSAGHGTGIEIEWFRKEQEQGFEVEFDNIQIDIMAKLLAE